MQDSSTDTDASLSRIINQSRDHWRVRTKNFHKNVKHWSKPLDHWKPTNVRIWSRKQVTDLEISRDEVNRVLQNVQQQHRSSASDTHQIQSLRDANDQFLREMSMLKLNIEQLHEQIQQLDEREHMLVHYPDLNGPIEQEPSKLTDLCRSYHWGLFLHL